MSTTGTGVNAVFGRVSTTVGGASGSTAVASAYPSISAVPSGWILSGSVGSVGGGHYQNYTLPDGTSAKVTATDTYYSVIYKDTSGIQTKQDYLYAVPSGDWRETILYRGAPLTETDYTQSNNTTLVTNQPSGTVVSSVAGSVGGPAFYTVPGYAPPFTPTYH